MRNNNQVFIPRKNKIEEAQEAAEQNDLKKCNKILEILKKTDDEQEVNEE